MAKLSNIIFEIKNTLSIYTVDLDMFMKIIIFYIVQISILFLLCLVDLDKLRVFFNNLTNKII